MLDHSHVAELISAYETGQIFEQDHCSAIKNDVSILPDVATEKPLTAAAKTVKKQLKALDKAQEDFNSILEHPSISSALLSLEKLTGLDRHYFVSAAVTLVCIYFLLGPGAQLLSNVIGFAYPAYASFKAIRSKDKEDDTQWLIYWCAFSAFYMVDSLIVGWASSFSSYWVMKTAFLVFLWLPQTQGAVYLYTLFVDPAVSLFDESIKKYID